MGVHALVDIDLLISRMERARQAKGFSCEAHHPGRDPLPTYQRRDVRGNQLKHSSDLPRAAPTEDLVLSGQNMGTAHICHGPVMV